MLIFSANWIQERDLAGIYFERFFAVVRANYVADKAGIAPSRMALLSPVFP
jgi:hypothetical protein